MSFREHFPKSKHEDCITKDAFGYYIYKNIHFLWIHEAMQMCTCACGCYPHAKGCWGYFGFRKKIKTSVLDCYYFLYQ